MSDDYDDDAVGYKKPPKQTRFKKGISGNPRGRQRKKPPGYILDRKIPMRVLGKSGDATMTEAALYALLQKGLNEKNANALKSFLQHSRRLRPVQPEPDNGIRYISWEDRYPGKPVPKNGACDELLEILGVVKQVQRDWPKDAPAFAVETWALEEALRRNGGEKLTGQVIDRVMKQITDPVQAREILTHHSLSVARATPPSRD